MQHEVKSPDAGAIDVVVGRAADLDMAGEMSVITYSSLITLPDQTDYVKKSMLQRQRQYADHVMCIQTETQIVEFLGSRLLAQVRPMLFISMFACVRDESLMGESGRARFRLI